MPRYEYACDDCGIHFDKIQHFADEPLEVCPECGGTVHRLIQPVGIIFKGSGFYVTDHKSSSSLPTSSPKADASPAGETAVSKEAAVEKTSEPSGDSKASEAKAVKGEAAD